MTSNLSLHVYYSQTNLPTRVFFPRCISHSATNHDHSRRGHSRGGGQYPRLLMPIRFSIRSGRSPISARDMRTSRTHGTKVSVPAPKQPHGQACKAVRRLKFKQHPICNAAEMGWGVREAIGSLLASMQTVAVGEKGELRQPRSSKCGCREAAPPGRFG
jgi:hypothetical protein